jgi:hypothetical protein
LTGALAFAAQAHANQRRKGAAQEPYINHLLEVLDLVACATGGADVDVMIAAVLHDTLEDTEASHDALAARFGSRVVGIVEELSDDMSLTKAERRRQRIETMPKKSMEARMVKTADVISNLRAIAGSPPAGWTAEHRLSYLEDCRQLIDAARGANSQLEAEFDYACHDAASLIQRDGAQDASGVEHAVRQLEAGIGQPVHQVHLANTQCKEITSTDIDLFCNLISRVFPSVIVQQNEALFDGRRRPILTARIRTDSTDAVVALAQRLCIEFDQRFVGIEVSGRYIRIYADDTG